MQRLFDGEVRAASITGSAPSARLSTHASNFSLVKRSVALAATVIDSIPNCRKQSASNARDGSLRPTKAVRAAAFRVKVVGSRVNEVPAKALSIGRGRLHFQNQLWGVRGIAESHKGPTKDA